MAVQVFTNDIDVAAFQFLSMPVMTFLAQEGNLDVRDLRVGQSGARDKAHGYVDEIRKNDLVVAGTVDLSVAKRTTETTVLGVAHTDSEPIEGIELPQLLNVGLGQTPDVLNQVAVEVFGLFLRTVKMAAGQTATLGGSVKYSTSEPNNFDSGTTGNGTYVVQGAGAGENAGVVFLHQGVLS